MSPDLRMFQNSPKCFKDKLDETALGMDYLRHTL